MLGLAQQSLNHLGMLIGDIGRFTEVRVQINEEWFVKSDSVGGADVIIFAERGRADRFIVAR